MAKPRVLVLRTGGTNCDEETVCAFRQAGAEAEKFHVKALSEKKEILKRIQILVLPGGFTYGDDIAAGRILANELRNKLGQELLDFIENDGAILGICNGFQVLVKTGLLPDHTNLKQEVTLTWNTSLKFEDRWVALERQKSPCIFVKGGGRLYLPVAHAEGRFFAEESVINRLEIQHQVVLRYAAKTKGNPPYPANPNGSINAIAGICDKTGRVFGMMPHPERYYSELSNPHWTRMGGRTRPGDGVKIFRNAVQYYS